MSAEFINPTDFIIKTLLPKVISQQQQAYSLAAAAASAAAFDQAPPSPEPFTPSVPEYGSQDFGEVKEGDDAQNYMDTVRAIGQDVFRLLSSIDQEGFNAGDRLLDFCHCAVQPLGYALSKADTTQDREEIVQISEIARLVHRNSVSGWTLLHVMADLGNPLLTSAVVHAGANVNAVDRSGNTPLRIAVSNGDHVNAELLLLHGANPNFKSPTDDSTALHLAAGMGHNRCVKVLVKYGADVNSRSKLRNTPALNAVASKRWDTLSLLISLGGDVQLKNKAGVSVIKSIGDNGLAKAAVDVGLFKKDIGKLSYAGTIQPSNKKVSVKFFKDHLDVKVKKIFGSDKLTFEWSPEVTFRISGANLSIGLSRGQEVVIKVEGDPVPLREHVLDIIRDKHPAFYAKSECDKLPASYASYRQAILEYENINSAVIQLVADDVRGSKRKDIEQKVGELDTAFGSLEESYQALQLSLDQTEGILAVLEEKKKILEKELHIIVTKTLTLSQVPTYEKLLKQLDDEISGVSRALQAIKKTSNDYQRDFPRWRTEPPQKLYPDYLGISFLALPLSKQRSMRKAGSKFLQSGVSFLDVLGRPAKGSISDSASHRSHDSGNAPEYKENEEEEEVVDEPASVPEYLVNQSLAAARMTLLPVYIPREDEPQSPSVPDAPEYEEDEDFKS